MCASLSYWPFSKSDIRYIITQINMKIFQFLYDIWKFKEVMDE